MKRCPTTSVPVLTIALLLSGCAAYYGGTEIASTEKTSSTGRLEKGAIKVLAIAPVLFYEREINPEDVERMTLDAYNQILRRAQQTKGTQFEVLTPIQFNTTLDSRMTEQEREQALVQTAKHVGASHVFVIETSRAAGGAADLAHVAGLQKRQATVPVSVKILGTDAGRALWREDFNMTVKFSALSAVTVRTEARRNIVETGVNRFLVSYGF